MITEKNSPKQIKTVCNNFVPNASLAQLQQVLGETCGMESSLNVSLYIEH